MSQFFAAGGDERLSEWLDGQLDARDIQSRELAQASGYHESFISRLRNGHKQPDGKQLFRLGHAAARVEAQRKKK